MPSRRTFLGLVAAFATSRGLKTPPSTGDPSALQPSSPPTRGLKIGTVTYNIAKDWDVDTIIKNLTDVGMDGVELRTTHKHGVELSLTPAQRAEVKKKFEDSPIELAGLGTVCEYHAPDPAVEALREHPVDLVPAHCHTSFSSLRTLSCRQKKIK